MIMNFPKRHYFTLVRHKQRLTSHVFTYLLRSKSTRIRLYPPLPEETVENMKTVVALNISFDKITWVMENSDRRLIDWRWKKFFDKPTFRYNHVHYQDKLLEAVNDLPDTDIYLLESSKRQTKSLGKVKYLVDAAVLEALLLTFINATKGVPLASRKREEMELGNMFDSTEEMDSERLPFSQYNAEFGMSMTGLNLKSDTVYEMTNKIYVFHNKNFKDICGRSALGERVSSYPLVTELIKDGTGPLAGLHIPPYFHFEMLKLQNLQDREALGRSLLMADSVVKFCSGLLIEEDEDEDENLTMNKNDSKI